MLQPAVAAEFIGRAREFRARFATADPQTGAAIDQIVLPLRQRSERHPTPRVEQLAGLARQWRALVPEHGRLQLTIDHRRTRLTIAETRIGAANYWQEEWDSVEPGILLLHMRLHIAPHVFDADMVPLAAVSLHALARRYQKAWQVGDAAIFADLCSLAAASSDTGAEAGRLRLPGACS